MAKVIVSCQICDADCVIRHDLEKPYSLDFCPFCGEHIGDDEDFVFSDYEDDDYEE